MPTAVRNLFPPLDQKAESIRLVKVLPGNSSLIECHFATFDLSDCPSFIALSYTWGPPQPGAKICIDGKPFAVRENLRQALAAIRNMMNAAKASCEAEARAKAKSREEEWWGEFLKFIAKSDWGKDAIDRYRRIADIKDPTSWKYFWIDAICINQRNTKDRNHQISLMSKIFEHAEFVIVWLGDADENSTQALDFLQLAKKLLWSGELDYYLSCDPTYLADLAALWSPTMKESLQKLYNRPYWSRLWVVQEFMRARDIKILYGNRACHWYDLRVDLRDLKGLKGFEGFTGEYWDSLFNNEAQLLIRVKPGWYPAVRITLYEAINYWGDRECEDSRDTIFGLLSLVRLCTSRVRPDYAKTAEEVFEDVLREVDAGQKHHRNDEALEFVCTLVVMLRLKPGLKYVQSRIAKAFIAGEHLPEDVSR